LEVDVARTPEAETAEGPDPEEAELAALAPPPCCFVSTSELILRNLS